MSDSSRVDVIIFGATGYTGKCVVQEFISISENKYTWAIAGRNSKKLQEVLEWATAKTGSFHSDFHVMSKKISQRSHHFIGNDVTQIPVFICNCDDESSLRKMTQRGRVVINCCGPYRFYGEPVVKACVESGTHHVDVSGEPEVRHFEAKCCVKDYVFHLYSFLSVHGNHSVRISRSRGEERSIYC